jgi:hypothetical protein
VHQHLPPTVDEVDHLVQPEGTGDHQRCVLADPVSGHDDGLEAGVREAAGARDPDHDGRQVGGYRVAEVERVTPPVDDVASQDVGGLGHDVPGRVVVQPPFEGAGDDAVLALEDQGRPRDRAGHLADPGRRPADASTLSRMIAIWTLLLASIRSVMPAVSMGASGRIRKSCCHRIRVPVPSGV